jgi:hypothetical protein
LAGREALWRAPAAVFEKPWGDHVDRDAFGHEELCRLPLRIGEIYYARLYFLC